MPLKPKTRVRSHYPELLDLPPPFKLVTLQATEDASAHAQRLAGPDTAGTLVFVKRSDPVEFALILEPEEALATARRVHYAGMVAIFEALDGLDLGETATTLGWPGAIFLGDIAIGGAWLAWQCDAAEHAAPDWLVFGAAIGLAALGGTEQPTSSSEHGRSGDLEAKRFVEVFARRFLGALDRWYEHGFDVLARDYLHHLPPEMGTRREIGPTGDLIVHYATGETERRALAPALCSLQSIRLGTVAPRD